MQLIPLQPAPSQIVRVQLANQQCKLRVYQVRTGMFLDLSFVGTDGADTLVIGGVICQNLNRIVRSTYLGFVGDLTFADAQGTSDPVYTGLGGRYELLYLSIADLALLGY